MLRLDQIDLAGVVRGRASDPAETSWWLDAATGAVQPVSSDGLTDADVKPGDWQLIHPRGPGWAYRHMADFVDQLAGSPAQESLDRALSGRLPFGDRAEAGRRFDDTLRRFPELQPVWSAFRDARAYQDAVRWLAKMGYVEPAEAEAAAQTHPDPTSPPRDLRIDADAIARSVAADLRMLYGERLRDVLLFGSYARGTAHNDSDLDLLVVLDDMVSPYAEVRVMSDVLWDHTLIAAVAISAVPVTAHAYAHRSSPFLTRVRAEARRVS